MLYLASDMASLATGSVNFPNQIYENPPQLVEELARTMLTYNVKPEIEVFDLAMLYNAKVLADRGLLARPCHVQFVMGIPNALPARRNLLEFLVSELKELMSDATSAATGIGRHQLEVNEWCLALGGHVRTGLEDNIKFDRTRLARSNAELVSGRHVRGICAIPGNFGGSSTDIATAARIERDGKTQWEEKCSRQEHKMAALVRPSVRSHLQAPSAQRSSGTTSFSTAS
jgi:uncharacterized protein (DUF849 family)